MRNKPEDALHMAVAAYLNAALVAPDWWTTFPAGSGGKARGGQLKAKGLKAGVPDILLLKGVQSSLDSAPAFWIELKAEKGRASKDQVETINSLISAGCSVRICRSVADVESVLRAWGFGLKARLT